MTAFRSKLRSLLYALLPIVLLTLGALTRPERVAVAQQPTPSDDQVNRIAKRLYCPVCENVPLDVCPTEACRQWRALIRQQLSEGWTEQQIDQYFVEQYGARVLAQPPRSGLNWFVYILPPLVILAGLLILLRSLRAWKEPAARAKSAESGGKPSSSGGKPGLVADEYEARLEEELKKRS